MRSERISVGLMISKRPHMGYQSVPEAVRFADLRAGRSGLRQRITFDRLTQTWEVASTGVPIPHTRKDSR